MPFSSIPYQSFAFLIYSVSKPFPSQQFLIFDTHFFAPPFHFFAKLCYSVSQPCCAIHAMLFHGVAICAIHLLSSAFPMRITAYRFLSIAPQFSSSPFHINALPCLRQAVPWLRTPSYAVSAHFTSIPRLRDHVLYSFIVSSESFSQVNFPFPEFLHWPSPRHTP